LTMSQEMAAFLTTAVRTWNPIECTFCVVRATAVPPMHEADGKCTEINNPTKECQCSVFCNSMRCVHTYIQHHTERGLLTFFICGFE
jgi:hypothetical protein